MPNKEKWQKLIKDKRGIEIGGPSGIFSSSAYLPIYPHIQSLDGVNFDKETVWEGSLTEGNFYKFGSRTGYQYIAEGTDLQQIEDNKYHFVLSCNNLEHIANPLKAIFEWKRVIEPGGVILLILPNKLSNFDHKRPYTSLQHIVNDHANNIQEDDLTHIDEILLLHDLSRDPKAGGIEEFKERCYNNTKYRCIHHHIFSAELLAEMMQYAGLKTVLQCSSKTDHYIAAVKC